MDDFLEDTFQSLYAIHKRAEAANEASTHAVTTITHVCKFVLDAVALAALTIAIQVGTVLVVYWCFFHKPLDDPELSWLDHYPIICGFIAFAVGEAFTISGVTAFFKHLITFGRDDEDEDQTERYRPYHATDDEVDGIPF